MTDLAMRALQAIEITGPDADGVMWVCFNTEGTRAAIAIRPEICQRAAAQWRARQRAALAKAN